MKRLDTIRIDPAQFRIGLAEFHDLLGRHAELKEVEVLRFFRERRHLASMIGSVSLDVHGIDRIGFEFQLFGDFACDLVVGDSGRRAFCFVEFEDARRNSVFVKKKAKDTPEWAPRFDHGYSQIIDWFWKLDDMSRTEELEHRFGAKPIDYTALLVVGRSDFLEDRERNRLRWRQTNVVVNSKHVNCLTLDELYEILARRINLNTLPD